ncbi:MAG: DUF1573 domain-containing protein [Bacteroidales bacterium]|nr:DUF1573 domain-containing protein [Bacteroidales bacterium]
MKKLVLVLLSILVASLAFAQEKEAKKEKSSKTDTEQVEKRSSVIFDKMVHDFGTLQKGDDASCVFTLKNVSKQPITLTNVRTSCGCTAAEWTKDPIAKKKKASIKVKYDSNRVGKFTKTIKVYIDGSNTPIQLEIKGTIVAENQNAPIQKSSAEKGEIQKKEKVNNK